MMTPDGLPLSTVERRASEDFREQVVVHVPQLRAFARGLTGDRDRADDLVQDTLVRALAGEQLFTPGTNLRAWLFTILRNRHVSECRRWRHDGGGVEDLPETLLATPAGQQHVLELKEVQRLLMAIPIKFREALILVSAAGMSYEEAATVCECAIGTIKSRVNRARMELMRLTQTPRGPHGENGGSQPGETRDEDGRTAAKPASNATTTVGE